MVYSLSENLKMLRIAKGLNQVDFAKEIGVTKQCVSNWENDNVVPSVEMLEKIADFFFVSTDFLLGREARATLDVSLLTVEQISHLSLLIGDFAKLNKK